MYTKVIGTGGIGKGVFFRFRDNRILGRNESRNAYLTEAKDYCKQHIVLYYISMLLSPQTQVIPLGSVGQDEAGAQLLSQMAQAGMDTRYITVSEKAPTMLSVCLQYPDKSGCNITADNSACSEVTPEYILKCLNEIGVDSHTMIVALPEVPLESRITMLRYGKEKGAFTAASLTVAETERFKELRGMEYCDLLALNEEEAAAVANEESIISAEDGKKAAEKIMKQYSWLKLWITLGNRGSVTADNGYIQCYPALESVRVINTGGAGDASLGGIISGICLGLPFHGYMENGFRKGDLCNNAAALGVLLGGLSVESADSINSFLDWHFIKELYHDACDCKGVTAL